jgi:hypothetical protein
LEEILARAFAGPRLMTVSGGDGDVSGTDAEAEIGVVLHLLSFFKASNEHD